MPHAPGFQDTVLLRIYGWLSSLYLELPDYYIDEKTHEARVIEWTRESAYSVYYWLCGQLKKDAPVYYEFKKASKLYFYHDGFENSFLRLDFVTRTQMSNAEKWLREPRTPPFVSSPESTVKLTCHEVTYEDVLKMISERDLQYSEWFTVTEQPLPPEMCISIYPYELQAHWSQLTRCPRDDMPLFRRLCWDIETNSSNENAFPTSSFVDDCIVSNSVCTGLAGSSRKDRKSKIIAYGHIPDFKTGSTPLTKVSVSNESAHIQAFFDSILEEDPDFLYTCGGDNFDVPYVDDRWISILYHDHIPHLGRIKKQYHALNPTQIATIRSKKRGQTGKYWVMNGRVGFDIQKYSQREHGNKFVSHSLDNLSKYWLGAGKLEHDFKLMFRAFAFLKRNGFVANASDPNITAAWKIMEEFYKYNVEDSMLVFDYVEKLNVDTIIREYSNIQHTQIKDLYTKGPYHRFVSSVYYEFHRAGFVLDKREGKFRPFGGGHVEKPKQGLHDYVLLLDFAQLYPTEIERNNICFTTLVPQEMWGEVDIDKLNVFKFTQEVPDAKDAKEWKSKKGKKDTVKKKVEIELRFVKPEIKRGTLPTMMTNYKKKRKVCKDRLGQIEEAKVVDEFLKSVFKARSDGLKLAGNAGYGALGLQFENALSLIEGAMLVTAKGREDWAKSYEIAQQVYKEHLIKDCGVDEKSITSQMLDILIYGDTDSIMIKPNLGSYAATKAFGLKVKKAVDSYFGGAMSIEVERIVRIMPVTPKLYAMQAYDNKGALMLTKMGEPDLILKGLAGARRDSSPYVVSGQRQTLHTIFKLGGFTDCFVQAAADIHKLLNDMVKYEDLCMTKKMGSGYTTVTLMSTFAGRLQIAGKPAAPGDALTFIVCESSDGKKTSLGNKVMLYDDFKQKMDSEKKRILDRLYYVEALLKKLQAVWGPRYGETASYTLLVDGRKVNSQNPSKLLLNLAKKIPAQHYYECVLYAYNSLYCSSPPKSVSIVLPKLPSSTSPPTSSPQYKTSVTPRIGML